MIQDILQAHLNYLTRLVSFTMSEAAATKEQLDEN
ncbi:unnamed protein product [Paramecium octaurelia]|uniref:Uncharacterized protein n=1 Tax=Paramecium octaurelia TaxID=43137 RepID=A0A8S1WTL6_PAROT|nr:unnamed protein product [Paramecium octaurelia]